MHNHEFNHVPPTYAPPLYSSQPGYFTTTTTYGLVQPQPQPIMMTTPYIQPPPMMVMPQPPVPMMAPIIQPQMMIPPSIIPPPPMMNAPTAASFIPSYAPTLSPGNGLTNDLHIPFSTNTQVYNGNPYYR